jgi:hypothetical protein
LSVLVARNGLGGFDDSSSGYVTAILAAEISTVAMGTACSISSSSCDGARQCSRGGLDGSINGGGISREGGVGLNEVLVVVMIVAMIMRRAVIAGKLWWRLQH